MKQVQNTFLTTCASEFDKFGTLLEILEPDGSAARLSRIIMSSTAGGYYNHHAQVQYNSSILWRISSLIPDHWKFTKIYSISSQK